MQYGKVPLLQTQLAKGETIVEKELSDARQALLILEGATQVEREHLTAEIVGEFRREEAEQKQDAESAKDPDNILEWEVFEVKNQFKNQDATWQRVLDNDEKRAAVTGLFLSNENTIGPAIDLLGLVLREASRDR